MGVPSASTLPLLASSSPEMMLSNVDLPQPLGPSRQTNSPISISRSTGRSASTLRPRLINVLLTPSIRNGIPPPEVPYVLLCEVSRRFASLVTCCCIYVYLSEIKRQKRSVVSLSRSVPH